MNGLLSDLPNKVMVVDVGPRDGLQNEPALVSTEDKIQFVDRLTGAGLGAIEVGAFVNPERVPQMADSADVCRGIRRASLVRYTALVPNLKGLARARAAGLAEVAIFAAATETFSQRNINQGIDQAFDTYRQVCTQAAADGIRVRAYLSVCFGCPYEGPVPPSRVAELTERLVGLDVFEVSISDTIGVAHPGQVADVLETLLRRTRAERLALHFHDTRGTALANVLVGLQAGVATFDASAGGLGGCPFAPGASGNLATEDLIYMLNGLGIETGVDLDALVDASRFIEARVGHPLPSRYVQAVRSRGREKEDRD